LINVKRRKLHFQGIEQRPDLRRVGHLTVSHRDAFGILEFIGTGQGISGPSAKWQTKNPPPKHHSTFNRCIDASLLGKKSPTSPPDFGVQQK
jgi:hypothetical protein